MSSYEIRIHGRGGQGNVVAANLLAMAAFEVGRHVQAFPNFGAERRGAPVIAFVRIADAAIKRRCQILQPGFVIIQDEALLHVPGVLDGLKPGGGILINSPRSASEFHAPDGVDLVTLPATQLAREHLGRPVPNTALLAAFLGLSNLLPISSLTGVLGNKFKGDVLTRNTRLIDASASQVEAGRWQERLHVTGA
jgi:pyruvate ferredoxin oxidoreductase gamma subunit